MSLPHLLPLLLHNDPLLSAIDYPTIYSYSIPTPISSNDLKAHQALSWLPRYCYGRDPPISFSLFTLADCTLFSHFSFNDFIATVFPDLAEDLDIQI